jgi:uncharacterized membrane protein
MESNKLNSSNWHQRHTQGLSFGQKIADKLAAGMGSWRFIIIQSIFVLVWIVINLVGYFNHWDPYPFILLNLLFSTQAAYAAPIIMMSQNRHNERDRLHAEADFKTNIDSKKEIEEVQISLTRIENEKLDKILQILAKRENKDF